MSDYIQKVNEYQCREGVVYDERYRLQPADFDHDWQAYREWRAGEPDYDAIEAAEEAGIAEFEARLRQERS